MEGCICQVLEDTAALVAAIEEVPVGVIWVDIEEVPEWADTEEAQEWEVTDRLCTILALPDIIGIITPTGITEGAADV